MPALDTITSRARYMRHVHDDPKDITARAREVLDGVDFDTMVGTGLSGACVIPLLARDLGKHWMIVRKDKDGSHSGRKAEGTLGRRWLFVDDLIDSGTTFRRVTEKVAAIVREERQRLIEGETFETTFIGSYLYEGAEFEPAGVVDPIHDFKLLDIDPELPDIDPEPTRGEAIFDVTLPISGAIEYTVGRFSKPPANPYPGDFSAAFRTESLQRQVDDYLNFT